MKGFSTAQRGSVVLVALCLTLVLGVAVAGYVAVCARTMEMSNRSFCTTSSVQLAEIGMEEALWSLNQAQWSGWDTAGNSAIKSDASPHNNALHFPTSQGIPPGSVSITVDNYNTTDPFNTPPTITATATLTMPGRNQVIQKQLKATVKPAALFSNAVGSTAPPNAPTNAPYLLPDSDFVYFKSGGSVDSYDSALNTDPNDPIQATNHKKDQAIISGPHISTNDVNILGYAAFANSYSYPPYSPSVDPSRTSNNANQYAFGIVAPTSASSSGLPDGGTLLPTDAGPLPSGYYSTTGSWAQPPTSTLTIIGPAIIYASSDFDVEGSITIDPSSTGPVQIYVGGNLTIAGNGINNQTLRPRNLAIFCTGTQGTINTTTPFYGAIYAPNSPLVVNSDPRIYGALVGQSVTFNGTPTIHYDLDLRKASFSVVNTPYDVAQWLVSN